MLWVECAGPGCEVHTRPSVRRLVVACRGWVPSGRALVHPDGGCFVAGRSLVRCRARTRPCERRLALLGTFPHAVVRCVLSALSGYAAPGGCCCLTPVRVPWLWLAACSSGVPSGPACCAAPRLVQPLSVLRLAFPTLWCLSPPRALAPQALLGGCAGHAEARREPGSLCLPLAPAEAGALGLLRVVPVRGPAMRLSLAGPSGVGLGLRALRWFGCVDLVTDASGFAYCLSFDGGLCWCTSTVSCRRRHLSTPGSRACVRVLVRPGRVRRAGLPGAFCCASSFHLVALSFCCARIPPGSGCPLFGPLFALPPPVFFSVFAFCASLSLAFFGFRPRVPWVLALCVVSSVGLPLLGSPCALAAFLSPAFVLSETVDGPPDFVDSEGALF